MDVSLVNGGYDTTPAAPAPVQEVKPIVTVEPAAEAKPIARNEQPVEKEKAVSYTQETLEKAIEQINKSIFIFNREMLISVHDKTKRIMVKVMDTEEKKVIRELPPEKVLDAYARTLELAGILVDKRS